MSDLLDLVRELAPHLAMLIDANRVLWQLEDRVRDTDDLAEKGRIKIEIDAANLHRHGVIAGIDAEVRRRWPNDMHRSSPIAHLTSESIGQMLDRATILMLKRTRFDGPELTERWNHLYVAIARAMTAVRSGRFVHHEVGELKAYGTR